MPDLASTGTACPPRFAYAKWRKIVVQNEPLRLFAAAVSIKHLRLLDRRQRSEGDRLGFSALKNGRTVCARQTTYFATDRSQILIAATIDPFLFFQSADAKRLFLDVIECLRNRKGVG